MASVELKNVSKIYDSSVAAIQSASLEIRDREFLVLVGPSGCGKTTILRLISGLEEATTGDIFIDSKRINDVAPKERDIAMVFQNYALYPHMNVYENLSFGLKLRKIPKAEIRSRIGEVSRLLELEKFLFRKPRELSGGQKQRVAMGRAIVREPKVFLMDEPLSNLDAQLRVQMRVELQKLHRRLGITTLYVTHDQTEAMTLGSRIVVMKDGLIQQIDTPIRLYDHPANLFVAGFIGSPSMNFLQVGVVPEPDGISLKGSEFQIKPTQEGESRLMNFRNKTIVLGIRPEDIHVAAPSPAPENSVSATVEAVELLGAEAYLHFALDGKSLVAKVGARTEAAAGSRIRILFNLQQAHFFHPVTGQALAPEK